VKLRLRVALLPTAGAAKTASASVHNANKPTVARDTQAAALPALPDTNPARRDPSEIIALTPVQS
jgi:hypothetical protein